MKAHIQTLVVLMARQGWSWVWAHWESFLAWSQQDCWLHKGFVDSNGWAWWQDHCDGIQVNEVLGVEVRIRILIRIYIIYLVVGREVLMAEADDEMSMLTYVQNGCEAIFTGWFWSWYFTDLSNWLKIQLICWLHRLCFVSSCEPTMVRSSIWVGFGSNFILVHAPRSVGLDPLIL